MPGEGKLYKLAPVMQEGGTLVTDEVIPAGGITFNCNGDVNNNGYDINIYGGTTIYFASEVRWNINGGEFISGLYPENPDNLKVNMYAQSGVKWGGINFNYCTEVNIDKTVFANVKANPSDDSNPSALLFVDCHNLDISYNEFNFSNLDSLSCISINYLESPEETPITAGVKYNVFNTGSNKFPSLICNGFAEATVPLMVNGNVFNSSSGNIAVFLSNVSAGVIKNNTISNYKTGVNILSTASYSDFFNNNITGDSIGVQIIDGSINLGMQGSSYTGGYNRISSGNSNANNLKSVAGYFTVPDGLNTFNINNSSAYHFGGTFSTSNSMEEYAGNNCFKLSNSQTTPLENVNCSGGLNCSVDFSFDPVNCADIQTNEYLVFDLGGGNYDTIYIEGGGMGGSISNVQSSMFNEETNVEVTSMRDLYNSICLEMRKRNYELVHTKCMELLNNYIDSVESLDGLSKLYHSSLMLDSLGNKMTPLKTFYETLILNNGENEVLIKKLFYLIQKCKVSLGQYQSAMSGFEQIMNQNPFSYEGLVASWDYAATSLLDSLHGAGGGMKNLGFGMSDLEFEKNKDKSKLMKSQIQNPNSQILKDDPKDKYDTKTFTKEDRKTIRENIFKSFESSGDKEIKEIKSLESKIREGKASESEKSEYNTKINLSEIIKVKNPKDITEHIKIVNEDIQKIFESGKGKSQVEVNNIIPVEYSLSQNYPNPFNPVTRIKFSLPEESSVKLTVYDILGREVKKLVNEKLSIGRYEYEFNGNNFASGVYFYTLKTYEFVQTRRMILIK